jgi:hypothetical protein
MTGQSAIGVPDNADGGRGMSRRPSRHHSPIDSGKVILASPMLVKWFGQYPNAANEKFEPLPVGINCFEHAPELRRVLENIGSFEELVSPKHKTKLMMVGCSLCILLMNK